MFGISHKSSLRLLVLLGLALALMLGCTAKKETADTSSQEKTTPPAETEKPQLAAELNVYNWSAYIADNTIADFEKEFGVKVNYDNYASNEELLAKLQAGVQGYDVIFPSGYMVEIMIKEDLLAPFDMANIPNFENIMAKFKNPIFDPGNKYSIPYQWGTSGLGVNTAKVQVDDYNTWDLLWDETYKNRITVLDDPRAGIIPGLKKLGYSVNTIDPAELNAAKDLMIAQKPLTKAYTSDTYIDLLKSNDVWISYGYSGDVYQAAADNPDVKYFIPREGAEIWIDNMCIPGNAPHKYTAEVFINYILRPQVSADISNYTSYASPNEAARPLLKPELVNDPAIYPSDDVLQNCEFIKDVGEATQLYDRMWNELKSE